VSFFPFFMHTSSCFLSRGHEAHDSDRREGLGNTPPRASERKHSPSSAPVDPVDEVIPQRRRRSIGRPRKGPTGIPHFHQYVP
jgi:hypothetical protein